MFYINTLTVNSVLDLVPFLNFFGGETQEKPRDGEGDSIKTRMKIVTSNETRNN